jgi:hypothetical protein
MKYTQLEDKSIKRENADGSVSFIPADKSNSDYQQYLAWLEDPEAEHLNGSIL